MRKQPRPAPFSYNLPDGSVTTSKNGSGKTTVGLALQIMQKIARGRNRVADLVKPKDLGRGDVPIRFEIEVELDGTAYGCALALELPPGFKELRVLEKRLDFGGKAVYNRDSARVHLEMEREHRNLRELANFTKANFPIDWHLVALPIIQQSLTIRVEAMARSYGHPPTNAESIVGIPKKNRCSRIRRS